MVGIITTPCFDSKVLTTPSRHAHQSLLGVQVDTEGRRSRFRSPPPPPGASPSLLQSTPGRYALNALSLLPHEACQSRHSQPDALPLIQPLVYQHSKTSSEKASEHVSGGVIRLHNWFITFTPVKTPVSISQDTSDLSHWIIVSGTRYKTEEGEQVKAKGKSKAEAKALTKGKGEQWHSSLVIWRETARQFRTSSGKVYDLVGPCNIRKTCHGKSFPAETADKFKDGLPSDWVENVLKVARKRGFVRVSNPEKLNGKRLAELSPSEAPEISRQWNLQQLGSKRKAIDDVKEEPFHEGEASMKAMSAELGNRLAQRKKARGCREDSLIKDGKETVARKGEHESKGRKGISRELLQLQTSKLGDLTFVQAAILEGLQEAKGTSDGAGKGQRRTYETKRESSPCAIPQNKNVPLTPLRASSRARSAISEWWKVSTLSKGQEKNVSGKTAKCKVAIRGSSPCPEEKGDAETSPAKSLVTVTDYSNISGSEDDYQCNSSSEDEQPISRRPSPSMIKCANSDEQKGQRGAGPSKKGRLKRQKEDTSCTTSKSLQNVSESKERPDATIPVATWTLEPAKEVGASPMLETVRQTTAGKQAVLPPPVLAKEEMQYSQQQDVTVVVQKTKLEKETLLEETTSMTATTEAPGVFQSRPPPPSPAINARQVGAEIQPEDICNEDMQGTSYEMVTVADGSQHGETDGFHEGCRVRSQLDEMNDTAMQSKQDGPDVLELAPSHDAGEEEIVEDDGSGLFYFSD